MNFKPSWITRGLTLVEVIIPDELEATLGSCDTVPPVPELGLVQPGPRLLRPRHGLGVARCLDAALGEVDELASSTRGTRPSPHRAKPDGAPHPRARFARSLGSGS